MNLTDRLRNIDKSLRISRPYPDGENNIYGQAADEIESLRERVKKLNEENADLTHELAGYIVDKLPPQEAGGS